VCQDGVTGRIRLAAWRRRRRRKEEEKEEGEEEEYSGEGRKGPATVLETEELRNNNLREPGN
jgi:hypothetical protein